jgi:hypothetical protein
MVNGKEVFSSEVENEIKGKVKPEELHIGLYTMAARGTPFKKVFSMKCPEIAPIVNDMPEGMKQSALSLFKAPVVAPVIVDIYNKPLVSLQAINKGKK